MLRSAAMTAPPAAELKRRLKELIVSRLKLDRDAASIDDAQPLLGSAGLGLDSIDALEVVLGIEQEFGVRIEDHEVNGEALASVEALAAFVAAKQLEA